ncbi:MAG: alpha-glucosidase [Streptococcaceae bacterium]|jgi:alpha-glucosidase|nr:alpha-glucosidase [Streptococcaceae bacterium]
MNDFHKMVGYQIYPKSFKDTNGDGIGDIQGIIEKLPYIQSLGVDFIWICPMFKSPQVDGGYDISDFYDIDPLFGTLDDFKKLLVEAHKLGLKVITDLVVNHTSDQHPWFQEARKSRENKYRDYYLWADATPEKLPNNWMSFFGIPAWTYDETTQQAYFHVFAAAQPDLNWKNPELREEIYKMVRWWLEEVGLDGFRLDAISHIQKAPWDFKIRSMKGNGPWQPFMNVAGIDDYMTSLKEIFDADDALTVGEASGVTSDKASRWTGDGGYVNMLFELEHNARKANGDGDIYGYKKVIMRWQKDMEADGWNALYLENHDQPRVIDAFGDGSIASAKALAVSYMLLRGTPFIYQGQEIGMTNFPFKSRSDLRSDEVITQYDKRVKTGEKASDVLSDLTKNARDHSRTPMIWPDGEKFSDGRPWMPEIPGFIPSSDLTELYQELIRLRHEEKDISDGPIDFYFPRHLTAFVYTRGDFLILTNLGETKAHLTLPNALVKFDSPVLSSLKRKMSTKMTLNPWEFHVFQKNS